MEEKKDNFDADFVDFPEEDFEYPENDDEIPQENSSTEETEEEVQTEITEEAIEEITKEAEEEPELSHWEELSQDKRVVKKYIVQISKNYVDILDNLSTEERNAYINNAIQTKLNVEYAKKQKDKKVQYSIHLIIGILTFIICLPIAVLCVHKAIMATYNNYKYSQENFEKLYKTRFQKEKSYIRYIQLKLEGAKKTKD